jgi:hypothetical protein
MTGLSPLPYLPVAKSSYAKIRSLRYVQTALNRAHHCFPLDPNFMQILLGRNIGPPFATDECQTSALRRGPAAPQFRAEERSYIGRQNHRRVQRYHRCHQAKLQREGIDMASIWMSEKGHKNVSIWVFYGFAETSASSLERMAGTTRLELATSAVTGASSTTDLRRINRLQGQYSACVGTLGLGRTDFVPWFVQRAAPDEL